MRTTALLLCALSSASLAAPGCSTSATTLRSEERLRSGTPARVESAPRRLRAPKVALNVMGPLVIGDPADVSDGPESQDWWEFERTLREARALGAQAVSIDIWWGLVEREDDRFDWTYYDRIADVIDRVGLRWVPILSFHQCGGNVGDTCDVPIPEWLGDKYAYLSPEEGGDAAFYRSEQRNVGRETLSVWATPSALPDYRAFMRAFQEHFAERAGLMAEIIIGLGPAGELRYPSYNAHDTGTGYPTRGALQSYGGLALRSFRQFVLERHGSLEAVNRAWGTQLQRWTHVRPPESPVTLFARGQHHSAYGRDFFDWYSGSLLSHGEQLLALAVETFDGPGAPFAGIPLGGKVAGVHWRAASDRAAELAAGVLQTSNSSSWREDEEGRGYAAVVRVFADAQKLPGAPRVVLHFTCLEMSDGEGGEEVASEAKSLVRWISRAAARQGVPIKGENALAWTLKEPEAWRNIEEALASGGYEGITILRAADLVAAPVAREGFARLGKGAAAGR